jgi:fatty acid desaturase
MLLATPAWTADPEYRALRDEVVRAGLLKKTPIRHLGLLIASFGLLALFLFCAASTRNLILLAALAVLAAFPRMWLGYIGHDIGHDEVFSSAWLSYTGGLMMWSLCSAISGSYWKEKHDKHHDFVNQVGADPDMDLPVFFSDQQRVHRTFLQKVVPAAVARYQHVYFFLLLPFAYESMAAGGFFHLFARPYRWTKLLELAMIVTNVALTVGVAYLLFGVALGAYFLAIHYLAIGTIMGLVFAPNHKGQPMFTPGEPITMRHQVIGTRNIRPSLLADFFYGGLNYQIEHHLFPYMSRFNLKKARPIIRRFCKNHGLPYHETTPLGSLKEMYLSLKEHAPA